MTSAKNFGFVGLLSGGLVDPLADPLIVKVIDGYRYSCGTSDPSRAGEGRTHLIPMVSALQI